jgi:hypothetical protein
VKLSAHRQLRLGVASRHLLHPRPYLWSR